MPGSELDIPDEPAWLPDPAPVGSPAADALLTVRVTPVLVFVDTAYQVQIAMLQQPAVVQVPLLIDALQHAHDWAEKRKPS